MINKRLSLILLAIVVVIEVVTLIFMRGDYRSVMTTGAEYKVPAQIQFKGISITRIIWVSRFLSRKRHGKDRLLPTGARNLLEACRR